MKRLIKSLIIITMFITSIVKTYAINGNMKMVTSDWNVYIGNTFTISITASCENGIGGVIGYLDYSSTYLTLSSTNAGDDFNKESGKLIFDATNSKSKTYTFTFTAKKIGSTTVKFNTNEFIDYANGDTVTGYNATVSRTVTIKQKPAPVVKKSSNNSLASLNIEGCKINFSSDVLDYEVFFENKIEELNITATTSDAKAKIEEINNKVNEGFNDIIITCTAEDGTKKEYKIKVYVQETPTIYYQYNNKKLGVVKYVNENIKNTFENEIFTINEEEVTLYKKDEIKFLYLVDENNEKAFYIYDEKENKIISDYQPIIIDNNEYLYASLNYEDYLEMDELFDRCVVNVNGIKVDGYAYKDEKLKDFKIIYLNDEKGNIQLYRYDMLNNMVIRYVNDNPAFDYTHEAVYLALAIAGGVMMCVSIIIIIIGTKKNKH